MDEVIWEHTDRDGDCIVITWSPDTPDELVICTSDDTGSAAAYAPLAELRDALRRVAERPL